MTPDHLAQTELINSSLPLMEPECTKAPQTGTLVLCERLPYEEAWGLQRTCRTERAADRCRDLLLLMEHPPIFTAGRTTQDRHWPGEEHLAQQTGIRVIRTERGGSITYHGPGQAIGYPILRLSDYCAGPKAYVHRLEEILIATLAEWGVVGHRQERLPGVWVGRSSPSKIAFIGVRVSQGITTHGFALNVEDGHHDLADLTVRQRIAATFAERFHLTWTQTIGPENIASLMEPPTVPLVTRPVNAQFSHEE